MLQDIVLFIPRLLKDVVLFIWGIVSFIGEFIWKVVTSFWPSTTNPEFWPILLGIVGIVILALLFKNVTGSGFVKSFFAILGICFLVGVVYQVSPFGAIVTGILSLLVGFGVIQPTNRVYMGLGLMWIVILAIKVMGH